MSDGFEPIPSPDEERWVLAGEFVLGLLPPDEAGWVEAAARRDAALATAIDRWREDFLELDLVNPPAVPDASLWSRIAATLGGTAQAAGAAAPATRGPVEQPGFFARLDGWLWSNLTFWRGLGMVGTVAAVALAVVTTLFPPGQLRQPIALTVLMGQSDQVPGWVVANYDDDTFQVLPLVRADVPADRTLELWTLYDQARGPVSMGTLPVSGAPELNIQGLPPLQQGQLFEISVEPPGGSPTGRPTGAVLFIGRATLQP